MKYKVITATPKYADKFRLLCQRTFEAVYPNEERGITKELFSKDVFDKDPGVLAWWNELASPTEDMQTWFVIDNQDDVIGGVVAQKFPKYVEMKTFYVAPEHQGKGIG
jgi:GNAT superfamily N-acetyltransferase